MSFVPKTVTYNNVTKKVLVGGVKLVAAISGELREYVKAETGETKRYGLTTVSFTTPNGKHTEMLASIHETNLNLLENSGGKLEVGKTYLATLEVVPEKEDPTKRRLLVRMSHLSAAEINAEAIDEMLELFGEEDVVATTPAFQEATSAD